MGRKWGVNVCEALQTFMAAKSHVPARPYGVEIDQHITEDTKKGATWENVYPKDDKMPPSEMKNRARREDPYAARKKTFYQPPPNKS